MSLRASLFLSVILGTSAAVAGPSPDVRDDPRLGEVRPILQSIVADAARAGLPSELLIDKIREGLAKNIPPLRILAATRALSTSLAEVRDQAAAPLRLAPSALPIPLVRALAEARTGGATPREIDPLLAALSTHNATPAAATRAAETFADLIARGFPPAAAGRSIAAVIDRDGLDARALERFREDATRLWRSGGTPEAALDEAAHEHVRAGTERADPASHGPPDDKGPSRDTSGQRGPKGKVKN